MPSLFALLHFNTQSHTKLPAEDLMQSRRYFRAGAFTEWKKLNKGDGVGEQTALFSTPHPRDFTGNFNNTRSSGFFCRGRIFRWAKIVVNPFDLPVFLIKRNKITYYRVQLCTTDFHELPFGLAICLLIKHLTIKETCSDNLWNALKWKLQAFSQINSEIKGISKFFRAPNTLFLLAMHSPCSHSIHRLIPPPPGKYEPKQTE